MEIIEPADPVKAALPEVERHLRHNFTGIPQIRGLGIGHGLPGDFKAIAM